MMMKYDRRPISSAHSDRVEYLIIVDKHSSDLEIFGLFIYYGGFNIPEKNGMTTLEQVCDLLFIPDQCYSL